MHTRDDTSPPVPIHFELQLGLLDDSYLKKIAGWCHPGKSHIWFIAIVSLCCFTQASQADSDCEIRPTMTYEEYSASVYDIDRIHWTESARIRALKYDYRNYIRSRLEQISVRMNRISSNMDAVGQEKKKIDHFVNYHKLGYAKRTGEACGVPAKHALSVYRSWKQAKTDGKDPKTVGKLQKKYNERKTIYEACMDKAIQEDPEFVKLLNGDPDAATIAASTKTGQLISFATANARYQQLKSELVPADDRKGFLARHIEPKTRELEAKYRVLQECLTRLDSVRVRIKNELGTKHLDPFLEK